MTKVLMYWILLETRQWSVNVLLVLAVPVVLVSATSVLVLGSLVGRVLANNSVFDYGKAWRYIVVRCSCSWL